MEDYRLDEILTCPKQDINKQHLHQMIYNSIHLGKIISYIYLKENTLIEDTLNEYIDENLALMYLAESYEEFEIANKIYLELLSNYKRIFSLYKKIIKIKTTLQYSLKTLKQNISSSRDFYLNLIKEYNESDQYTDN